MDLWSEGGTRPDCDGPPGGVHGSRGKGAGPPLCVASHGCTQAPRAPPWTTLTAPLVGSPSSWRAENLSTDVQVQLPPCASPGSLRRRERKEKETGHIYGDTRTEGGGRRPCFWDRPQLGRHWFSASSPGPHRLRSHHAPSWWWFPAGQGDGKRHSCLRPVLGTSAPVGLRGCRVCGWRLQPPAGANS